MILFYSISTNFILLTVSAVISHIQFPNFLFHFLFDFDFFSQCSLFTFDRLVAKRDLTDGKMKIRAEGISDFISSVGRARVPESVSAVLLFKMLETDDCSLKPAVKVDVFDKEIILFAKKNHLYKISDYEMKKNG